MVFDAATITVLYLVGVGSLLLGYHLGSKVK